MILFLTVSTSLVLGIVTAYGAVAAIITLFARQSGQSSPAATGALDPVKAMQAAAGQASGD